VPNAHVKGFGKVECKNYDIVVYWPTWK